MPERPVPREWREAAWWAVPLSFGLHGLALAATLVILRPAALPEPQDAEPVAVLWEAATAEAADATTGAPAGPPTVPMPAAPEAPPAA
ncbi:MAG: hypothetical protein K2X11_22785, partial [Acetobacteraceae bacterium]|nr:hypothetical protein [Acetobacteraceae bacterium]